MTNSNTNPEMTLREAGQLAQAAHRERFYRQAALDYPHLSEADQRRIGREAYIQWLRRAAAKGGTLAQERRRARQAARVAQENVA